MLKRPSSRRKGTNREQIVLTLVPVIDTMVTLIGFMLFTTSFLAIVGIESPFPEASVKEVAERIKEKPLQLTVTLRQNETQIWSPFEKIRAKTIPDTTAGDPDTRAIHDAIVAVKQQFPKETKVVVVPYSSASYDTLIAVMDSLRVVEPTDPPIYLKNPATGLDEPVKMLFPEIIFGNLLGGT